MAYWLSAGDGPSETEAEILRNTEAARRGRDAKSKAPGLFSNTSGALGHGVMRGGALAAQAGMLAGSIIPRTLDFMLGDDLPDGPSLTDRYFELADDSIRSALEYWQPDQRTTGAAARALGSVAEFVAPMAISGGNPLAMAITTSAQAATSQGAELARDGATAVEAGGVGAVQGLANLVGIGVAMRGATALQRAAFGAGSNVAINVPADAASAAILNDAKLAERYDPFNVEARATDLIVGALFGVMARGSVNTVDMDAAMTTRQAQHTQYDSAPGKFDSPVDAAAHMAAMRQIEGDLLAGRAPELSPDFEVRVRPDPARADHQMAAERVLADELNGLSQLYDVSRDSPIGPADDPMIMIQPEDIEPVLVSRGGTNKVNSLEVKGTGWGVVKIVWRHGEKSKTAPEYQVRKSDLLAFPSVIREFEPEVIPQQNDVGSYREWRVELPDAAGGLRQVVFLDKGYEPGSHRRLMTMYVQEPNKKGHEKPLSALIKRPANAASPSERSESTPGDTSSGFLHQAGQQTPAPERLGLLSDGGNRLQDGRQHQDANNSDPAAYATRRMAEDPSILEMPIAVGDTGEPGASRLTARQALDNADLELKQAQELAGGYEAAINCFLNGGV